MASKNLSNFYQDIIISMERDKDHQVISFKSSISPSNLQFGLGLKF